MKTIISIENPTQQVILALANVIAAHDEQSAASTEVPDVVGQASELEKQQTTEPEKTKRQRRVSHSESSEQTTTQEEQPASSDEQSASQSDAPTVVELRAKAQEVGTSAEAKKAIKALLDKFEAKSISSIPEEKRVDFLAELDLI
jgi:hypothetical protein